MSGSLGPRLPKRGCRLSDGLIPKPTENTELACAILTELGHQMPFLLRATAAGSPSLAARLSELENIGRNLSRLYGEKEAWIAKTVRGYVMLSLEFLKLQRELEKSGRYLLSSEREALQAAYDNEKVFGGYYLPGLLLSEALWPNHFVLGQAFKQSLVSELPKNAHVLEVGVGTGYHLDLLLTCRPDVRYTGFDISSYAIDFCRHYAFGTSGEDQRVNFIQGNVSDGLPFPGERFDAIVMGEILEHIDNPAAVLRDAIRTLRPEGAMFLTTVAFAANIDHIFMFERIADIRDILADTGWEIKREWPLPVYPSDNPEMPRRPMNYGALLVPERSSEAN